MGRDQTEGGGLAGPRLSARTPQRPSSLSRCPSQATRRCPAPHALCTATSQAWGVQKGAGPTSRDSCGGRKPLKAPASPSSVFSSQAHLFSTATDHLPLLPSPSSPRSPGTVPATPPPGQQQDTWPAEKGARALGPALWGGKQLQRARGGRGGSRREAGAAWGRPPRTQGAQEPRGRAGRGSTGPSGSVVAAHSSLTRLRPNISPRPRSLSRALSSGADTALLTAESDLGGPLSAPHDQSEAQERRFPSRVSQPLSGPVGPRRPNP